MSIKRFRSRFDKIAEIDNDERKKIKTKSKAVNGTNSEDYEEEVDDELSQDSEGYYLTGGLTDKQLKMLDKILGSTDEELMGIRGVLRKNAEEKGLKKPKVWLRNAQIKPVLMSYHNPRFFIGDKPGLGKTVMSAGAYAYYQIKCRKKGIKPSKILVVTDGNHVLGFANEWEEFGIRLLPLLDGTDKMRRKFKKANMDEYDGIIINWDGLKTNGFLEYYLEHADEYQYGVFDETSTLLNDSSTTYRVANKIINEYRGGIERVIFLNGSSFEKNIFDFYYQFSVLKPKLIPTKSFLESRYVVRKGRNIFVKDVVQRGSRLSIETVQRKTGEISDYKNQAELRDRLKYYYIARTKRDYSNDIPEHTFRLHPVEMTKKQYSVLEERQVISLVNSPKTSDPKAKFDFTTSPKLKDIVEFADMVSEDRPILYVYNKEAQETIANELKKRGYRVGILNGDLNGTKKKEIQDKFNSGRLDMLVFNVQKAINLPTSERVLFYDIPMMPQQTNQIKGRIDRNNYKNKKFYDFFCYLDSPEMVNIVRLAYFREHHGNEFTGQVENVYKMLVQQLHYVFVNGELDIVEELMNSLVSDEEFEEIREDIEHALGLNRGR